MWIIAGIVFAAALSAAGPAVAQTFGVASFYSVVNAQGETVRGLGVQSSARTGAGRYIINFTRPVTSCAFVASVNGGVGGQASVTTQSSQRVVVFTFSTAGARANRSFNLIAFCAP